jgi:hypothetical protein
MQAEICQEISDMKPLVTRTSFVSSILSAA